METTATAMTMATLLSTITEVFSAAVGWVGTVAEMVDSNPHFLCYFNFKNTLSKKCKEGF